MAATASSNGLANLSKAARALAVAKSFDEVLEIRDKAVAAQAWIRAAKLGVDMLNDASELKLRAERKAGKYVGDNTPGSGRQKKGSSEEPFLEQCGISKKQSHIWQQLASVPEETFESHVETTKDSGKELTTASVLRLARGEPAEREDWTIGDVIRALSGAARRIFDKCPEQDRETMAYKLRALGDEILENGELRG